MSTGYLYEDITNRVENFVARKNIDWDCHSPCDPSKVHARPTILLQPRQIGSRRYKISPTFSKISIALSSFQMSHLRILHSIPAMTNPAVDL